MIKLSHPKYITALFIFIHVVMLQNFGFVKFKSRKLERFAFICSLLQFFIITVIYWLLYVLHGTTTDNIWRGLSLIEFAMLFGLLNYMYLQNNTFNVFLTNVIALDKKSQLQKKHFFPILCISMLLCFLLRLFIVTAHYYYKEKDTVSIFLFIVTRIPSHPSIFTSVACVSMFLSVRICIKGIIESIITSENVDFKSYLMTYKAFCDTLDKFQVFQNKIYSCMLLFTIPKLLVVTYNAANFYKYAIEYEFSILSNSTVSEVKTILILLAPAAAAGLLCDEANRLRLTLHDFLLRSRDKEEQEQIMMFIRYMKARPLRYYACKVIPIGWRLPVIVMNVYITYVIVIMQFINMD